MKNLIKKALRRTGFEVIRRRPHVVDLLVGYGVDVVLDVGANEGQFGEYLRSRGYRGRIVSFEPLPGAFARLAQKAALDRAWTAVNVALGSEEKSVALNVSRATDYSSILGALPILTRFAGEAVETAERRQVPMRRLDAELARHVADGERVFLKVDTQGYEKNVVLGARASLPRIVGVQLELSLRPLYAGESPLPEMVSLLEDLGFEMALFDPVTYDAAKGTLLQIDAVFFQRGTGPFAEAKKEPDARASPAHARTA